MYSLGAYAVTVLGNDFPDLMQRRADETMIKEVEVKLNLKHILWSWCFESVLIPHIISQPWALLTFLILPPKLPSTDDDRYPIGQ